MASRGLTGKGIVIAYSDCLCCR